MKNQSPNRAGFRLSAARLAAVQALYEIEIAGSASDPVLKEFIEKRWRDITLQDPDEHPEEADKAKLANPDPDYLTLLVDGVRAHKPELTDQLDQVLEGDWNTERLDRLMYVLLSTALFELKFQSNTPTKVLISEYNALTHAFFEDNEAAFAAGIISTLAKTVR